MKKPILYPFELEHYWVERACEFLGVPVDDQASLRGFEKEIQALSDLFTKNRPAVFSDYTQDRLSLAYGLFFFPQSFARMQFIMSELVELCRWKPSGQPLRILDLGAGLGGAGLSVALFLRDYFKAEVIYCAADHGKAALGELQQLHARLGSFFHSIELKTLRLDMKKGPVGECLEDSFDCIMSSFAWNEAFLQQSIEDQLCIFLKWFHLLNKNGVCIVVEPALKETALNLQRLADQAVVNPSVFRWAPGFYKGGYPQLEATSYVPHEVRSWSSPASVEFLNRHLFRMVGELKYHFMALGRCPCVDGIFPAEEGPRPMICRLTTPMRLLKGRFEWSGLDLSGSLLHYECLTRHLSKDEQRLLLGIERGDTLCIKHAQSLKQTDHFRVDSFENIVNVFRAAAALTS